ncbi:MAG: glutamate-5-semialdehyde dehydrogenase [Patescibacteria group bacterium]
MNLRTQLEKARDASREVALLSTAEKNAALKRIAAALVRNAKKIETANIKDLKLGERKGLGEKLDRLKFDTARIKASAKEVGKVMKLPDPVGRVLENHKPLAKFKLQRVAVPLGVIAMIYESRPNVTVDAIALSLKSGNAIVLRGSSEALNSNRAIVKVIHAALQGTKVPAEAVQLIDSANRKVVGQLLKAREYIDLVIPRGGPGLIDFVVNASAIPVIETGASVVHLYVDQKVDLAKAVKIAVNGKTRRVSICNALDTLLVHEKIAKKFLGKLLPELEKFKVRVHTENKFKKYFSGNFQLATSNYSKEWLSYDLNLKIVKNVDDAIKHIQKYSLQHTEAIVTEDKKTAEKFLQTVDAACVYHNLSTQFSDGGEFGLGAEIGISTQKLHARGPFALEALTTYKWVGRGRGEVRGN